MSRNARSPLRRSRCRLQRGTRVRAWNPTIHITRSARRYTGLVTHEAREDLEEPIGFVPFVNFVFFVVILC